MASNQTQPNRECRFYNWGGDEKLNYTSYPTELGARCEHPKRETFFTEIGGRLAPDCSVCTLGGEADNV